LTRGRATRRGPTPDPNQEKTMTHPKNRPGLVFGTGLGGMTQKPDTRIRIRVIDTHASTAYAWQNRGACRGTDAELFFGPDGERIREKEARENRARAICASCPVLAACREHALSAPEKFGIWAGMDEQELEAERHERKRAAKVAA